MTDPLSGLVIYRWPLKVELYGVKTDDGVFYQSPYWCERSVGVDT